MERCLQGVLFILTIQKMVEDKTYPDISKLKHVLKMKNAGSIDDRHINKIYLDSNGDYYKQRTSSFDLIYFLIPNDWDEGKGFDYQQDLNIRNYRSYSWRGSNWYQYPTYCKWENEGIYTINFTEIGSYDEFYKEYN